MKKYLFSTFVLLLLGVVNMQADDAVGDKFTAEVEGIKLDSQTGTTSKIAVEMTFGITSIGENPTCNVLDYDHETATSDVTIIIPAAVNGYKVVSIGTQTFAGRQLAGVQLPSSLEVIGYKAFERFTGTVGTTRGKLTIPEGVKTIGEDAFIHYNTPVSSIELPSTLTTIGSRAFGNMSVWTRTITIPASVTSLGAGFAFHSDMTELIVEDGNTNYVSSSDHTVIMDSSRKTLIQATAKGYVPSGVETVGAYSCASLKGEYLLMPASVKTIGEYAFYQSSFSYLRLSGDVTVGNHAFDLNYSLKRVDIMGSNTRLNSFAFHGCEALDQVYIHSTAAMPKFDGEISVFGRVAVNARLYVPESKLSSYDNYPWNRWFESENILPFKVIDEIDIDDYEFPAHDEPIDYDVTTTTEGIESIQVTYVQYSREVRPEVGTANESYLISFRPYAEEGYIFKSYPACTLNGETTLQYLTRANFPEYVQPYFYDGYTTPMPEFYDVGSAIVGDVDGNRMLNSADVVAVYDYIIGGEDSGVDKDRANVDGDAEGKVNSADVVAIYNAIINGTHSVYSINGANFGMLPVEGGAFMMGTDQTWVESRVFPRHEVTVSDFSIGETEVTQALWEAVMGSNPSKHVGADLPVESVSWNDAQLFVNKLNRAFADQLDGKVFRLPTEAEWEYAARGGKKSENLNNDHSDIYAGNTIIAQIGWFAQNSNGESHPVAQLAPNQLGIYDMSGNVYEMCYDRYSTTYDADNTQNPSGPSTGTTRVIKGGCYGSYPRYMRLYDRYSVSPTAPDRTDGLRLVLAKPIETPSTDVTFQLP